MNISARRLLKRQIRFSSQKNKNSMANKLYGTDQIALGDGIWLVLSDDGDFGVAEVNHSSPNNGKEVFLGFEGFSLLPWC